MSWITSKTPNVRYWAVRNMDTREYYEEDHDDAFYFAGIPHWKTEKRAREVAEARNAVEREWQT